VHLGQEASKPSESGKIEPVRFAEIAVLPKPPAPVPPLPKAGPIPVESGPAEKPADSRQSTEWLVWLAMVQTLAVLGVVVTVPLLAIVALVVLLRRWGVQSGAVFRVEVINTGSSGQQVVAVPHPVMGPAGPATPGQNQPAGAVPRTATSAVPPPSTAKEFVMVPSFEEEPPARAEARNQEASLLQGLFEQNRDLQRQIHAQENESPIGKVEAAGRESAENEWGGEAWIGTFESYHYEEPPPGPGQDNRHSQR
jgi:hypothetical protein